MLKKLIASVAIIAFLIGCGNTSKIKNNVNYGSSSMKIAYEMVATTAQVDSICAADTLPPLKQWKGKEFIDYEGGAKITKRMYTKRDNSIVYIVKGIDEPYIVIKRVVE